MATQVVEGSVVHLKVWNGPLQGIPEAHFGEVILQSAPGRQLQLGLYFWSHYEWPSTYEAFSVGAWISMIQNALTNDQRLRISYDNSNNSVLQVTLLPTPS